jgi:hypothetical protein
MSIVLNNERMEIPGVETVCWLDDPKKVPHQVTDGKEWPLDFWPRHFTIHTTNGTTRKPVKQGFLASTRDWLYARYQASTTRYVSWHFTIDIDGTIAWSADPMRWMCWHAGNDSNKYSIGFELVQGPDGLLYSVQLDRMVTTLNFLSGKIGIPKQFPEVDGKPFSGMITRLTDEHGGGKDICGAVGHRNIWARNKQHVLVPLRGFGDPGDHPFHALREAKWSGYDYELNKELLYWMDVQRTVGLTGGDVDGVPGPKTQRLMKEMGLSLDNPITRLA